MSRGCCSFLRGTGRSRFLGDSGKNNANNIHELSGDNIGAFPNSGCVVFVRSSNQPLTPSRLRSRLIKRWGIHHELSKHCAFTDGVIIRKYDGDLIVHQRPRVDSLVKVDPFVDAPLYDTQRADLHRILLSRARELGAVVRSFPSRSQILPC